MSTLRGKVSLFSSRNDVWAWDVFFDGEHVRGGLAFGVCAANTAAREWMHAKTVAASRFFNHDLQLDRTVGIDIQEAS